MLKIFFKIILLINFIFLISCDNILNKEKEVSSGLAQNVTVYTKVCSAGSLKIDASTSTGNTYINADDLPVGAEVSISGTVNNGSVCGFTGPVSFSCRATVRVDLNKTFSCIGENTIIGTSNNLLPNPYSTGVIGPNVVNPNVISPHVPGSSIYSGVHSYQNRILISGDFNIYYGATKTFVSLLVNSSSALVPNANCKLSFICD
ncbi:MAG: hypothetical protein OXC37_03010 [Bdellovibrionaceae bacterium]|nr:hypothetical protein [Pseudobdellovibrionaceae bacterium]